MTFQPAIISTVPDPLDVFIYFKYIFSFSPLSLLYSIHNIYSTACGILYIILCWTWDAAEKLLRQSFFFFFYSIQTRPFWPGFKLFRRRTSLLYSSAKGPRLHTQTRQVTWRELILQREPIFLSLAPRGRINSSGREKKEFSRESLYTHWRVIYSAQNNVSHHCASSLYISSSKNVRANIAVVSLCWRSVNRRDGSIAFPTPCKLYLRLGLLSVKKTFLRTSIERKRNG